MGISAADAGAAKAAGGGETKPAALQAKEVYEREAAEIRLLRGRRGVSETSRDHVGLAFSGGGIRSATFNLGVLQGLARQGLLRRVDYLSTVSGGGYIGSWLVAWIARRGIAEVEAALKSDDPTDAATRPVQWLREYSNYLTPRMGAFGADTWAGVSAYLRNVLLNQIVLISAMVGLLLLPYFAFEFFERCSAPWAFCVGVLSLAIAAVPLALHLAAVEHPARSWLKSGQFRVQVTVVWPSLCSVWFAAAWLWSLAKTQSSGSGIDPWPWWLWAGGAAALHGGIWLFADILGSLNEWWGTTSRAAVGETRPRTVAARPIWYSPLRAAACAAAAGLVGGLLLWVIAFAMRSLPVADARPLVAWKPPEIRPSFLVVVWAPPAILASFVFTLILHVGLMGRAISDARREWWSRLGGWIWIYTGLWIGLFALTLYGPLLAWYGTEWVGYKIRTGLTIGWVASTLAGLFAGRSAATNGQSGNRWLALVARLAPYVFIAGLAILLSWGIAATMDRRVDLVRGWLPTDAAAHIAPETAANLLALLVCVMVTTLFSWRVDINEFSLHALYRNRLIRCYLGASAEQRERNEFSGFSLNDDLPLWALTANRPNAPNARRALETTGVHRDYDGPYPLVNTALNHSAGANLAWQERKASSMVLAPRYCGFVPPRSDDGREPAAFRPGQVYAAGRDGERPITLGTALAISGAAASPNMGYHSSPPLAFLMTLFNVRLGWWMANPRNPEYWPKDHPPFGFLYLLSELFGYSTDKSRFVYLSDGGHFDNLGVYELVRRRCRYIVACDGSADPDLLFADLGSAIRKCRADLGAEIDLDVEQIRKPAGDAHSKWHCAVGTIRYPNGERGTIVYLKASLTGDEPGDVRNYASAHASFPHQTTADQFFDESQFESYRTLGAHVVDEVFARAVCEARADDGAADMEDLFVRLRQRWYPPSPGDATAFARHSRTLDEIATRIRQDGHLRFLDGQLFPEWKALTEQAGVPQRIELWLPKSFEELRSGFYLCVSVIQLMEDVFHELDLDANFDHPRNAGWVNLLKHWSWCGMLRATWAVVGSTHDARFQNFCVHRLELETGRKMRVRDAGSGDLNFVERRMWERIRPSIEATSDTPPRCLVLAATIADPADARRKLSFDVGFAVTLGEKLVYLRIQDHLRCRGLGRAAMRELCTGSAPRVRELGDLPGLGGAGEHSPCAGLAPHAGPAPGAGLEISDAHRASVRRMFESVRLATRA